MKQQEEKLIYKIYSVSNGTIALINFVSSDQYYKMPFVRSALFDEVKNVTALSYRIDTGVYEDIDVHIRFIDCADARLKIALVHTARGAKTHGK